MIYLLLLIALGFFGLVKTIHARAIPPYAPVFDRRYEPKEYWTGVAAFAVVVAGLTYVAWISR